MIILKVIYDEIVNVYSIKLKIFEPDDAIKGIILAVHGFCVDMESSVISGLAERMTEHGIAVVTFNFPGHGDKYFNLANCCADVTEVIEYIRHKYSDSELNGVFAAGFGGYVTLLNLDKIPYRTKIILCAPAVRMSKSFKKFVPDMEKFRSDKSAELGFGYKLNISYSFYRELCANDIFALNINRPMMIIYGNCDDVVPAEDIQKFCRHNPLAELNVIERAGHRFKNTPELKQAIDISEKYFMEE